MVAAMNDEIPPADGILHSHGVSISRVCAKSGSSGALDLMLMFEIFETQRRFTASATSRGPGTRSNWHGHLWERPSTAGQSSSVPTGCKAG